MAACSLKPSCSGSTVNNDGRVWRSIGSGLPGGGGGGPSSAEVKLAVEHALQGGAVDDTTAHRALEEAGELVHRDDREREEQRKKPKDRQPAKPGKIVPTDRK